MKESIPKQRTDADSVLAAAGLEFTPTHVIAAGYRFRLDSIAAYGAERQVKHYRRPALAFVFSLACIGIAFGAFGGLGEAPGQVFGGIGLLLAINGTIWTLMARRSPAVELILTTGRRERLPLPSAAMMSPVLAALDGAMGGSRR